MNEDYSELIKYLDEKFIRIDQRFDEIKEDFVNEVFSLFFTPFFLDILWNNWVPTAATWSGSKECSNPTSNPNPIINAGVKFPIDSKISSNNSKGHIENQ